MVFKDLQKLMKDEASTFTLILGTGYHAQTIGSESILSNWEVLLKKIDKNYVSTGFYLVDFEQLISRQMLKEPNTKLSRLNASETEKEISKKLCNYLRKAQNEALKSKKNNYVNGIFSPDKVSDVISLNFDTIAEEVCCMSAGIKKAIKKKSVFMSEKGGKLILNYWEVPFESGKVIRFWYPHGSIHQKDKLKLGAREYAKQMSDIERLRRFSKKKEKDAKVPTSWYHRLVHNPVLILGADLSMNEWDLWFAIVNRNRNFAKSEFREHKKPIFQMRESNDEKSHQNVWFRVLFEGMDYPKQWDKLANILNQ
jgi:hypothetical protein